MSTGMICRRRTLPGCKLGFWRLNLFICNSGTGSLG
ncbi:hypothetical protein JOE31_001871 [Arthrobacter sp. PvP023]|nr:hypothetical protein [Arthrobacter sp. PvP023]